MGATLNRRRFLAAAAAGRTRPNVVLALVPRDEAKMEGLQFSRAYAACPAHPFWGASILTGRFPHMRGAAGPCAEPTLLSEFRRAGYSTALIGDWGCGRPAGGLEDAAAFLRANIPNDFCLCAAGRGAGLPRTLDETGLARDTMTVLVGGGDGDGPGEESARVPLAIRFPRRIEGNRTIEFLVSTVDLAPTVLAWCGIPAPSSMQGRDLSKVILTGEGDPPESVYVEGGLGRRDEWRMVVRGLDKLVVNARLEVTHLYNLGQDPFETTNLASDGSQRRARDELLALVRRWILRTGDRPGRR